MPQFFSPYNFFNAIVYNFFAFLALSSHLRAMLSDPVSFNWFKLKVTNVFLWLNFVLLFFIKFYLFLCIFKGQVQG